MPGGKCSPSVSWVKLPIAGRINVIRDEERGGVYGQREGGCGVEGAVGAGVLLCIIKRLFLSWGFLARMLHFTFLVCFHLNVVLAWDTWTKSFPRCSISRRWRKGSFLYFISGNLDGNIPPLPPKNPTHPQQLLVRAGKSVEWCTHSVDPAWSL